MPYLFLADAERDLELPPVTELGSMRTINFGGGSADYPSAGPLCLIARG